MTAVTPRARILRAAKLVISLGLLAVIGVGIARTEGIEELPARLGSIEPLAVLAAAAMQFGSVLVGVERWRRLLLWQGITLPYARLCRIFLVGRFVGAFTPGTTGLDVVRALEVARLTGEAAKSTAAVAVEKVFGLLGLALCALAMLPLGAARFFGPSSHLLAVLAALGSLAVLGLVLRPRWLGGLGRFLPSGPRAKVEGMVERLSARPPSLGGIVLLTVLAMGSHAFTAACYAASGLALHVDASLGELAVVGFSIVVATLLPISAGGAGVREGTAVLLLRTIGVPASEAVLVALVGYLATQPPAIVGGLVQAFGREKTSPAT